MTVKREKIGRFEIVLTVEDEFNRCDIRPLGTEAEGNIEECDAYGGFEDEDGIWHKVPEHVIASGFKWAYENGY